MLVMSEEHGMSERWRKIQIPDPDGDSGYLLIPPDDSPAKGPIWAEESFVDHLVHSLNFHLSAEEVGMSVPVPEPEHYDILFTPARAPRKRGTTATRRDANG